MTTIQIKKDGQDPQVINLPEGAKIIIEDGITVVEPEFKDGDIVFGSYNGNSWIGIFNKYINNNTFNYHARICNYSLEYSDYVSIGLCQRLATESERQLLIDILAKDGKQWNPGTKQIEELKYIPKVGDCVKLTNGNESVFIEVSNVKNGRPCGYRSIVNGKTVYTSNHMPTPWGDHWRVEKITPEELQVKFNGLGYEYNFETHTAEKLRWKPKKGETYYYPDQFCSNLYRSAVNDTDSFDKKCIELKLAFKTPEEAIKCAKKMLSCL